MLGKALLQQILAGLGSLSAIAFMLAMTIPWEFISLNGDAWSKYSFFSYGFPNPPSLYEVSRRKCYQDLYY